MGVQQGQPFYWNQRYFDLGDFDYRSAQCLNHHREYSEDGRSQNREAGNEPSKQGDQLLNDVHPVFRRTNFPGADYAALSPSLRLASLFLETDCLLNFWHALWFGVERKVYHNDSGESWHWAYFRRTSRLSARDVAMTRSRLRTLAHMVRFFRGSITSGGVAIGSEGCYDDAFLTGDFRGSTTTVLYNEALYQELCSLDRTDAPETRMRVQFDFAKLMLHELAHAAHTAAYGEGRELPFEEHTMGEAGYDFENYVFGGVGLLKVGTAEHTLAEWPSASIAKLYAHEEWPIWVQDKCSDQEIQWAIPFDYIQKLYTTAFWRTVVPRMGAEALKVPLVHARFFRVLECGCQLQISGHALREQEAVLPEHCCIDREEDGSIRLIAPGFEWEGFGRLMKIDHYGLFPEARLSRSWRTGSEHMLDKSATAGSCYFEPDCWYPERPQGGCPEY